MVCPNCGAWTDGKQCEYCGTRFITEPTKEEQHRAAPAEKETCASPEMQPTVKEECKGAPVFSKECTQKTDVESPKDTFQLYESILQVAPSIPLVFLCTAAVMIGADELGVAWFAAIYSAVFFWIYLIRGLQDIAEYCKVNYAKKCDAKTLWKQYQGSPADSGKQYHDQWLRLTVCFSGFLNNSADGTLIAGCASYQRDGTEFELVFAQKAGKEHLVPEQVIRVAGKCKGLQGERLRIEDCFVLEISGL